MRTYEIMRDMMKDEMARRERGEVRAIPNEAFVRYLDIFDKISTGDIRVIEKFTEAQPDPR